MCEDFLVMSDFKILTWEEVKPIWDTHLWPGRDSEPVTSMVYLGGHNMQYKKGKPYFVGFVDAGEVIAVNSYVCNSAQTWRSRGLWVHPKFRGCGYAGDLLSYMFGDIRQMGGDWIWTMPRRGALEVYESVGFVRVSEWEKQGWGVNCYAKKDLLH